MGLTNQDVFALWGILLSIAAPLTAWLYSRGRKRMSNDPRPQMSTQQELAIDQQLEDIRCQLKETSETVVRIDERQKNQGTEQRRLEKTLRELVDKMDREVKRLEEVVRTHMRKTP